MSEQNAVFFSFTLVLPFPRVICYRTMFCACLGKEIRMNCQPLPAKIRTTSLECYRQRRFMAVVISAAARGPTVQKGGGCYEIPGCISHFVSVIFCMYRVAILTLQDHEWVDFQIYFRFENRNVLNLASSVTNSSYGILSGLNYYNVTLPQYAYPTQTVCCTSNHECVTTRNFKYTHH